MPDATWDSLPAELQRVAQLPDLMRQCFVLRILARWPASLCARVLRLRPSEVDEYAGRAAVDLTIARLWGSLLPEKLGSAEYETTT